MIIGITGSLGAGKTTVADIFGDYGFKVVNADRLYAELSKPNTPIYNKIKKAFGNNIIKNSCIDKEKLKKIVFNDCEKLQNLNKITHPAIIKGIKRRIANIKNKKSTKSNSEIKIAIDAPLLIEAKAEKLVDKIIVVTCGKKEQIKRALKKGRHTKQEIYNIMKSQMPLKEKIKKADFVVDNSKTIKETRSQVASILNQLKE